MLLSQLYLAVSLPSHHLVGQQDNMQSVGRALLVMYRWTITSAEGVSAGDHEPAKRGPWQHTRARLCAA